MSTTTISRTFYVGDPKVATNPTSATITITYSGGTVVTDAVMTAGATGVVYYSFTDPSVGVTYSFTITYVYDSTDYAIDGTELQSTDNVVAGTMTSAGIKEVVWRRIQPHNVLISNIEEETLNAIIDITDRQGIDFLIGVTAPAIVADQTSITVPSGYKRLIQFNLTDVGPLERISYDLYQSRVQNSDSTGEPREFAENNNKIYLWPTPGESYTSTFQYAYTHPRSLTTIYLRDSLREAVYNKIICLLFKGQLSIVEGSIQKAADHNQIFERELGLQAQTVVSRKIRQVKYST